MSAQWLSSSSDVPGRVSGAVAGVLRRFTQPAGLRRLRLLLIALLALWAVAALSALVWSLFPTVSEPLPDNTLVINPVSSGSGPAVEAPTVNIERMMAWHLFGEAGVPEVTEEADTAVAPDSQALEGIEKDARETRLDLTLRGVVASTEEGQGHAIIEYRSKQDVYAVDDKLPVSGQVVLAKVLPGQVVLDNKGTYELLTLFEQSALDGQLAEQPARPARRERLQSGSRSSPKRSAIDKRADTDTTELARGYRERLYQNPQSLAEVVTVNAVREEGELLGYRIGPGKEQAQFEQLGFKPGDLVTGINGIALDDPANTMRLYQTMRSATEAVFDLQRGEQRLSVSVNLGAGVDG